MTSRRILTFALLSAVAAAPAAEAHVTAQPPEQPAGAFTVVTFRAPNERPVPTTKLAIQLPPELDSVRVQPVEGWTYKITRKKLPTPRELFGDKVTEYVSTIEWTGNRIGVDEFHEFPVSMKLPDKGNFGEYMTFPALQTYRNGEVVRWIQKPETPTASFDELDEPVPHIQLIKDQENAAQPAAYVTPSQLDDEVSGPRTLAIAAIVIGAVALLLTGVALRRKA